jgi:hypothetical protein
MTPLKFTHANLNTPIYLVKVLIFAWYYSEAHKSTLILSAGGAMVPVKESVEDVDKMLHEMSNAAQQGQ